MTGLFLTIDRYVAARFATPFLVSIAIVIMLLSLENAARLMDLLDGVEKPAAVLFKFMFYLIPEYLGIGLLFATFLATALCFRSLALSGELDILWAVGMSPLRALRVPMIIGLAVALLHIGLRGYVQPWGEQRLDALGYAASSGELGVAIKANTFYRPTPHFTLHVDHVDRVNGAFTGVFVKSGKHSVFARRAFAVNVGQKGISLTLRDGNISYARANGGFSLAHFGSLELPLSLNETAKSGGSARHRNDRIVLHRLIERLSSIEPDRSAIAAALGTRLIMAASIPLLPVLALLLGVPPKRTSTAWGLGGGIAVIVCFIQISVAIEEYALPSCNVHQAVLLIALAAFTGWLKHYQTRHGPGSVEARLDRIALWIWKAVSPFWPRLFRLA